MFNELKVVKYFKEITDCKILERNHETFQERVFKTREYLELKGASNIEVFCESTQRLSIFTKDSIIDVRLSSIEIFKINLS